VQTRMRMIKMLENIKRFQEMRYIFSLVILFQSTLCFGIGVSCGDKLETYNGKNGSYIDTCPDAGSNLKVFTYARGSNYHSCNLEGIAVKNANDFVITKGNCIVVMRFSENTVSATFSKECKRAGCGARANWKDGVFTKK
jgi:hypothetical protein